MAQNSINIRSYTINFNNFIGEIIEHVEEDFYKGFAVSRLRTREQEEPGTEPPSWA